MVVWDVDLVQILLNLKPNTSIRIFRLLASKNSRFMSGRSTGVGYHHHSRHPAHQGCFADPIAAITKQCVAIIRLVCPCLKPWAATQWHTRLMLSTRMRSPRTWRIRRWDFCVLCCIHFFSCRTYLFANESWSYHSSWKPRWWAAMRQAFLA